MRRRRGGGEAFIIDAARTSYGLRGGALSPWHPVDLSAELLSAALARAGAAPGDVGDVIWGCTSQVGAQSGNIARRAVLAAGWPETVPGASVDRQAASSAQAVHWAAHTVMAGAQELVVAGGVEVMSAVPLGAPLAQPAVGKPLGRRLAARYPPGTGLVPPGLAAEEVARRCGLSRGRLDEWVLESFARAYEAQAGEMASFLVALPGGLEQATARQPRGRTSRRGPLRPSPVMDEALARPPTAAAVARLPPLFLSDGVVTAANMAAEGDGAAAVVVAGGDAVERLGLAPKARVLATAVAGADPATWPLASVPATARALASAGVAAGAVGSWHVLETSAAAVLGWAAAIGADLDRVNPLGGELASTCPVGAAGAGLFAAAVARLERHGEGCSVVCAAGDGGVATACVVGPA